MISDLSGRGVGATARITGGGGNEAGPPSKPDRQRAGNRYRGAQGLDPAFIKELERQYGFDKPAYQRFGMMIWNYLRFDFGESYFRSRSVVDLVHRQDAGLDLARHLDDAAHLPDRHPARHPQGRPRRHPVRRLDQSRVIIVGYAVPAFLFAILLIVLFAGGSYWQLFPAARPGVGRFLVAALVCARCWTISGTWSCRSRALMVGAFASLTMLTKNSFLEEINKQYVLTARAKGLTSAACSTAMSSATRC